MNMAMTCRKGRSDSSGKEALELVPVARRTPPPRPIRCAPAADAEKILLAKSTFRPQTIAERIIADSFTGEEEEEENTCRTEVQRRCDAPAE